MSVLAKSAGQIFALCGVALAIAGQGLAGERSEGSLQAHTAATSYTQSLANRPARKPNILFVIMDDVGIDQLSAMGYGGPQPVPTPTIDAIAKKGLRFRNTWSMPECSNGRMALLTGRYPFRTNVYQAIGQSDLANSHVSPYDVTVARMMKQAGYKSGLFGKYHLGGPENNQLLNGGPGRLGWDYFYGWIDGLPASIDTTAGGAGEAGTYSCGYVPSTARAKNGEGADYGACYTRRAGGGVSCRELSGDTLGDSPGLACLNIGGILAPKAQCAQQQPISFDFDRENAHYVSQVIINQGPRVTEVKVSDPRGRNYRSSIEVNAAIQWINAQRGRTPWMATVSFSADHTPLQTPPGHLLSPATRQKLAATLASGSLGTDCANPAVQRILSDAMIEAMDAELGRLLISTGLAKKNNRGQIEYDPRKTDTVIVIVGDNGSFGTTVKVPFDIARSKASPYQTGLWVPLVVSGPMVNRPGRDVPHLTNATDVFGLFGEVAGLNPQRATAPRRIDAAPLLPYLVNPNQFSIRTFNFAEGGLNIQKNNGHNGPCVIGRSNDAGGSCSQTPINKGVCEDNGGVWWGEGATDSGYPPVAECWEVNQTIYNSLANKDDYSAAKVSQAPQLYYATRDSRFKLVDTSWYDYDPTKSDGPTLETREELYEVNESKNINELKLDREGNALYIEANGAVLLDKMGEVEGATESKQALEAYVEQLFATEPACPGDGNGDGVVNIKDLVDYRTTVRRWTGSSTFDFNYDAVTNNADRDIILQNIRTSCR